MKNQFVLIVALLNFISLSSNAGSGPEWGPDTQNYVRENGRNIDYYTSQEGLAANTARQTARAQQVAEIEERSQIMNRFINGFKNRQHGISQWRLHRYLPIAELRKIVPAVGTVAVIGTAVGFSPDVPAATVRMKDADGNIVRAETQTQPGTVSNTFRAVNGTSK